MTVAEKQLLTLSERKILRIRVLRSSAGVEPLRSRDSSGRMVKQWHVIALVLDFDPFRVIGIVLDHVSSENFIGAALSPAGKPEKGFPAGFFTLILERVHWKISSPLLLSFYKKIVPLRAVWIGRPEGGREKWNG